MKEQKGHGSSIEQFAQLYRNPDPYQTRSRFYEQKRLENSFRLLPRSRRFKTAIDVGCGEGEFTMMLTSRADSVTGVDFVPAAIERARATYGDKVRFLVGGWEEFLSDALPVDLITCSGALEYSDDQHRTLRQVARIVRPDGMFLLIGSVGKKHGYHSYAEWPDLLEPHFQIVKTAVVSPALRGQRFFNHPWFFPKRPVYWAAMLLARALPGQFSRHVGWLCTPRHL